MNELDQITLERAWLKELMRCWQDLNETHFRGAMKQPAFRLSDGERHLGRWMRELRIIEIARSLCTERPWGVVVEVLKHEMAHQYVDDVLRIHDEPAHGPSFRSVCERLRIDSTASGLPADQSSQDETTARFVQRIAKLLALAESQNEHEAQAAMAAAQRLMLVHNIKTLEQPGRRYTFRHLGAVKARHFEHEYRLATLLEQHFFVQTIWTHSFEAKSAKSGRVLEICGATENLDLAEYVYAFVGRTSDQLWKEHKRSHRKDNDSERRAFLAGVVEGFDESLRTKHRQSSEQGLVWSGDLELRKYFRVRYPRTRSLAGSVANGGARAHGHEAGRKLVLHRPIHERAHSEEPRRLEARSR